MGKFLRPYHPCRVVTTRGRKAPVITRMRRWIKSWRPRDWILTGKNSTIPLGGKWLGKSHLGGIKTCICYGGICGICLYIMANVLGHRMFTRKINGFWTQENGGGWFGPFSFSTIRDFLGSGRYFSGMYTTSICWRKTCCLELTFPTSKSRNLESMDDFTSTK